MRGDQGADGGVNITRVGREERAIEDQHFAGCVGGRVVKGGAGHVEGVLEGGLPFGVLGAEGLDSGYVVIWIAGEGGDGEGEAVARADYAELGNGVLFEEFDYEGCGVAECEEVASWA